MQLGLMQTVRSILQTEGVAGFWRGTGPSVVRSATLTASQCATYDEAKHFIISQTGWDDALAAQFLASMLTGLVTTTATNPVDVVKTQMYLPARKNSARGCVLVRGTVTGDGRVTSSLGVLSRRRFPFLYARAPVDHRGPAQLRARVCWEGCFASLACLRSADKRFGGAQTNVVSQLCRGPFACAADIFAKEGVAGFYRGWSANYLRLGPQTCITFVVVGAQETPTHPRFADGSQASSFDPALRSARRLTHGCAVPFLAERLRMMAGLGHV